jgi:transcriptional regulator with XRE-family HTH domain
MSMLGTGERLQNIRRLRMWTQARLAQEAGVSPVRSPASETGKIGRPHFGTLGKLVRALGVAPEELLDSLAPVEQQDSAPLSLGGRESGEGESKVGLRTLPSKASIPSLAGWMLSKSVSRGSTRIFLKAVSKGGS